MIYSMQMAHFYHVNHGRWRVHCRCLEGNNIESIPPDAFTALVNLRTLYVPPCITPMSVCIANVVM